MNLNAKCIENMSSRHQEVDAKKAEAVMPGNDRNSEQVVVVRSHQVVARTGTERQPKDTETGRGGELP